MIDWNKPLAGASGLALFASLVLFGTMIGLSIAVLSQAVAGEHLLSLWGPALGASIGATATVSVALYSQRKTERREVEKHLNAVIDGLNAFRYSVTRAQGAVAQALVQLEEPGVIDTRPLQAALDAAQKASVVKPDPALPRDLRNDVASTVAFGSYLIERAAQAASAAMHARTAPEIEFILQETKVATARCVELIDELHETLVTLHD